jgi:Protein of unknown function (DUF2950)
VAAAAVAAAVGADLEPRIDEMISLLPIMCRSLLLAGVAACFAVSGPAALGAQEAADPASEVSPGTDTADQQSEAEAIDMSSLASAEEPPLFDEPGQAVDAFKAALVANDLAAFAKLLGLDVEKLKADENTMPTFEEIREAAAKQLIVQDLEDRKLLALGDRLWPFPFPLVKVDAKWAFNTFDGLEEIVNRRIGENELQAINTVREYVDAQRDYASVDRDADGVREYAQKLISTAGETDGIYWPSDQGDGESPAGDLSEAALEKARQGSGYFGYRFRILTAQGDNVAGGDYDYVINGNMIGGFALLAWPVEYEETGVNTFAVNQHGIVYQIDLGTSTEAIVKYIESFNPDDGWSVVDD